MLILLMKNLKLSKRNIKTNLPIYLILIIAGLGIAEIFTFSTNETKEDQSYQDQFNANYKVYSLNLPENATFAEEEIPLGLVDVQEKLDRELHINTYWQSNTLLYLKKSNKWFSQIEPILEEEQIPNDFKYLALIESGLANISSPAGASGFWQIMKATGRERGLEINSDIDERYHLKKATKIACAYLKEAKEKFGSWSLAAASYNMGMSGLKQQLNKQQVNNYFDLLLNEETGRYVYRIIAAKEILSNPNQYGFKYREKDLYKQVETYDIAVDTTINNLSNFSKSNNINYKVLKMFNPWLRTNRLPNSSRRTYEITLPKKELLPLFIAQE